MATTSLSGRATTARGNDLRQTRDDTGGRENPAKRPRRIRVNHGRSRHYEEDCHGGLDESLRTIDALVPQGHQLKLGNVLGHGTADRRAREAIRHGYRAGRARSFEATPANAHRFGIVMYETTHGSIP
ncbi:hypothetical protein [Luteibacter rhizovicinus]|uniref:hypothetical protein n=1 Tax=Luteibacter rhizovicinus TaxID=242606 RepID=UPI000F772DEB|nr:hypothetical protein [Luteibacter rhizovicinus]